MDQKDIKKSSTPLGRKEVEFKTTLRVQLTTIQKVTIKNTNNNKIW
jgi:hypothetical protein